MCKLNSKVDVVFKKLFASSENKDLLISFINSILSEDQQISDIELKNPYNIANYIKGEMNILYIKAVDTKGVRYDIEMQLAEQRYYYKRVLYYLGKAYSDQIEIGDDFETLRKTIAINILDFNYIDDEEDFHNVYKIFNTKSKKKFSNIFQMHFVELNKFKKDYENLSSTLDRWVIFLNRSYDIDLSKIPEELAVDKEIKKALEKLDIMHLDSQERAIYENDLKVMRDFKARLKTAERKGREAAKKEAKIQMAKKFLNMGVSVEKVAAGTGLNVEEVRKLEN